MNIELKEIDKDTLKVGDVRKSNKGKCMSGGLRYVRMGYERWS